MLNVQGIWTPTPNDNERLTAMMHYWNYMTSSASQGYLLVLLDADQITLLSQGDRRGCKGQRAQAIMSAIGITSWYEEGLRVAQQVAMERYRVLKQTGANHTTPRLLSPDQSVLIGASIAGGHKEIASKDTSTTETPVQFEIDENFALETYRSAGAISSVH